jgi:general secretion pathway protein J
MISMLPISDGLKSAPQSAMSARQTRQGGFTLIEVLLAITLVALIMALAYGGFRASNRATTSGEALIEETNQLRVTHQFIRRQLSLTQNLIIEEGDEEGMQIRFEGEGDRVRFVAPMPGYLSYGGSYVQQISLERGSDGLELVYYYAMLNGYEPGEIEQTDGIVLMSGFRNASFMYLGLDEDGFETFWDDHWEETDRLPLAVVLEGDLDRDNGLVWPDLFAPVMMDSVRGGQARPGQVRRPEDLIRGSDRRRDRARR